MSNKTSADITTSATPLPDNLKNLNREQFLSAINPGERFSHSDLYWILYRAASETKSVADFYSECYSLLDSALGGPSNYVATITAVTSGTGGTYSSHGNKFSNVQYWGGAAGVLPGSVAGYAVICTLVLG